MEKSISIKINLCKHLKDISCYNYNYYSLPEGLEIMGCNVILQECDEFCDSYQYTLGNINEGAFRNDGNHITFPSSYGSELNEDTIYLELDREGEFNT